MDVLIVGAGIGGLTAAIGLRDQGHRVTLFEQSQLATESGAAIFLPPNANGLLRKYGFPADELGAVTYRGHRHFTPEGKLDFEERVAVSDYKEPFQLIRRSSLHSGLKHLALDPDAKGTPAKLLTSSRVKSVDPDKPSVTLEDGTEVKADLIIGADGAKSKSRAAIGLSGNAESLPKPFSSGKNCFRFMIDREKLLSRPETGEVYKDHGFLNAWFGEQVHLVSYPCEFDKVINYVAIHPAKMTSADGNDYDSAGSKDDLRKIFEGFPPTVQTILELIDYRELKLYPLLDMESLPTFVKGRFAAIGDAAHPFLPYLGQGGAQAIEDGISVATLLPANTTSEEVPARLRLYEVARKERVEKVQQNTRMTGSEMAPDTPLDFKALRDYNFNHDEIENSRRILQQHVSGGS